MPVVVVVAVAAAATGLLNNAIIACSESNCSCVRVALLAIGSFGCSPLQVMDCRLIVAASSQSYGSIVQCATRMIALPRTKLIGKRNR